MHGPCVGYPPARPRRGVGCEDRCAEHDCREQSIASLIPPPEKYRRTRTNLATRLAASPAYASRVDDARDADLLQELYSTGLLVGLLVDEELENAGVPGLFSFLGWIARLQPVTPGMLAAETGLPATTIRDYVRRLGERGDVRKVPNPKDGRSYHLVLTAKGQKARRPRLARRRRRLRPRRPAPRPAAG